MVEYDVGLKPSGGITALKIRGYFLCGAFLDLGFNDMMVLKQGVDQVQSALVSTHDVQGIAQGLAVWMTHQCLL